MNTDEQLSFNVIAQVVGIGSLVVFSVVGGYVSDKVGRRKPSSSSPESCSALGVICSPSRPLFGDAGGSPSS